MPVISFVNSKGGVGKSTLSVHVSRALQLKGYSVLLVDSDPQASSLDWSEVAEGDYFTVIGLPNASIDKEVSKLKLNYDYVVIDGAAKVNKNIIGTIKASDLVILPVRPSPVDVWATRDTVDMITDRQQITDGWPVAGFLISVAEKGTKLSTEIGSALEDMPFDTFDQVIHKKAAYPNAMAQGLTALEISKEAKEEIDNLVSEIEGFFKNGN